MDISSQTLEANIALIQLDGRLDATTGPNVQATLQSFVDQGFLRIIVDLQQVPFIDS